MSSGPRIEGGERFRKGYESMRQWLHETHPEKSAAARDELARKHARRMEHDRNRGKR